MQEISNLWFFGLLYKPGTEKKILSNSSVGVDIAANLFQWNVIKGIADEAESKIKIVNCIPVGTWPNQYKELFLYSDTWKLANVECNEIGTLNIPFFKQLFRYMKIKRFIRMNVLDGEKIVIYSTYLPYLKAVANCHKKIEVTLIVTDIPEFYDLDKTGKLRAWLREGQNKQIYALLRRIDKFVLLTDAMRIPLMVGERPYVIIEGIVNDEIKLIDQFHNEPMRKIEKKIILYTGTLHYQYGISKLLLAFREMDIPNVELWICGSGEAQEEIKQLSQIDERIRFLGFRTHDEIIQLQSEASLLVNPRTSSGEYTKYSFPSKTMEYMASGKPVIMHKLSGIPEEYFEYLYTPVNDTTDALRDTMELVLSKKTDELEIFGERARRFIIEKKSISVQGRKIVSLLERKPKG